MPNYSKRYVVHGTVNHSDGETEDTWTSQPLNIGQVASHIKQVMYDEVYIASSFMFIVVPTKAE